MFKRFFTMVMVLAIFTVQAHATTQNGLKAAFDEMNFSLSVDWDGKDQSFYEAQLKKITQNVRELQKQGLTNQQMIDFAKSEIKDARVARDLETAFSMITINKMSSEDASKYMLDSMKRAYSHGASWNGDALVYAAVGLLIVALAIGLSGGSSSGSSNGGGGYSCTNYSDCYYYSYNCGYDFWGPVYCQAYTCDSYCY